MLFSFLTFLPPLASSLSFSPTVSFNNILNVFSFLLLDFTSVCFKCLLCFVYFFALNRKHKANHYQKYSFSYRRHIFKINIVFPLPLKYYVLLHLHCRAFSETFCWVSLFILEQRAVYPGWCFSKNRVGRSSFLPSASIPMFWFLLSVGSWLTEIHIQHVKGSRGELGPWRVPLRKNFRFFHTKIL